MQNQPNSVDGTRGAAVGSSNNHATHDQQQNTTTTGGLMPPPTSTNASSSDGRIPRRLLMQAHKRPGTEFVPRERPRESFDDVLANHQIGKRSGQRLIPVASDNPLDFFEVNTYYYLNQAQSKDDDNSVLSSSILTVRDSDSGMSMISSKTGQSVFSSSEEEQSPEEELAVSTRQDIEEHMEEVTSTSEDGGSVKVATSKPATKSTVKIRQHVDTPKKQLEISKITTKETEQDKSILEDINKLASSPNTITYSEPIDFGNDIGLGNTVGFETEQDQDALLNEEIFSSQQKKTKYSREENEDRAFSSQSLPSGRVDLYQDEADYFSQPLEQSYISEKYIPRERIDLHDDDLDDDLAKEVEEEMERVDQDYPEYEEQDTVDLNTTMDNTLATVDLVTSQQEKVVAHGLKHDLTIENTVPEKLRPRLTTPCRFWQNERPIAEETGKLSKIRPLVKNPPAKSKAPQASKKKAKVSEEYAIVSLRQGVFDVINENYEEEKVKIAATPEMVMETNFRFNKDGSEIGFSTDILPANSTAKPHMTMFSLLNDKGISTGTLIIQPGQVKPSTDTGIHSEIFYCLSGSVSVRVHTNPPVLLKRGCVLHVPPHNAYSMGNAGNTACKLFYVFADMEYEEEDEQANTTITRAPESHHRPEHEEEHHEGRQEPNHKTTRPPTDIIDESV
ncbi:hypothetical protein C9374_006116 [Naegleria lovaniensis]|uniref:Mif2/CENP-C cupin domain-containing protein n=1 Tax=Naegleria lovaniensis TaxID=51637 RepID=A0AA88GNT5_NAELO|nr:uncharacterized protein C9374_006116 [Naegleria lovaniensis]KAG2381732.1 hypothetical protein C9374_006116 [Naegleria lovaniensis]